MKNSATSKREELTQARLKDLLHYDPATGAFTWRQSGRGRRANGAAGHCSAKGYVQIGVDGFVYEAHRLAWLYQTGAWPGLQIDHIDRNKSNNAFNNLRDVSSRVNNENKVGPTRRNSTGYLGVHKRGQSKYAAEIRTNGQVVYLGRFATPEDAHAAYVAAKRKHHEGCTI